MRKLLLLVFIPIGMWGQNWKYDFGTGTGSHTSGASTAFVPAAPNGTSRVRVGSAGGSFNLDNPGLSALGTSTELRIVAPTTTSVNKFNIADYTAAKTFTTKFTILLGNSTGGNTASSGTFYFFQGDGASFSDNNGFTGAQIFTGLRFVFGASGAITLNNRAAGAWSASGISGTPFAQGNVYQVEMIGNNTTSTISYSRGSVAANTFDLYVNGTLIGDDLAKAQLGNDVNIDSWMFYGENSTGNVANIFLDDFEYANYICGHVTLNSSSQSGASEQCIDGDWTLYGTTTNRHFAINKNGNTLTPTVDITVSSAAVDSSKSSNGANQEHASYLMNRYWNVDCGGCTPTIGGGVSVRFFYDPADSTAARNAMRAGFFALKASNVSTLADTTTSIQWVKNNTAAPYAPSMFTGNRMTVAHVKLIPTYGTLNGIRYVQFDTIKSFSGGGGGFAFGPPPSGGGGVGLPVTWAGFDAVVNTDHTELLWQTASELNTSHFEVEASEDGKVFTKISDNIPAAGNSASLLHYSFIDRDLAPIKYYRLRQVDIENVFEYSKIIVAKRTQEASQDFEAIAYPLTTAAESRQYQLLLKNTTAENSAIQVIDYTGKPVYAASTSNHLETLELSHLCPGIYMLVVWNGGDRKMVRIAL